jgi:hypothetical protein
MVETIASKALPRFVAPLQQLPRHWFDLRRRY